MMASVAVPTQLWSYHFAFELITFKIWLKRHFTVPQSVKTGSKQEKTVV